jgi:ATP-dependent helicase HrpA
VRFADRVSEATRLVLMTDGLLLAEIASDPLLRRYDTVIVDEAHERTLNIDLLLGVLRRLLPRRPDLQVIVTSATLDVERVSRFFGDAPILTVSGRSHPIEVRYATEATALDAQDPDLAGAVLGAYRDIAASRGPQGDGDVLVFLPGEREIRDVGDHLARELGPEIEVLALYSRLSWDEQSKIFERGSRRRIVLATNLAETSVTVPGIRAVVDSGLARVSRYSPRNRLQRLPTLPVSQASADQRKGRCGRLGPGLCVRLYTEADFEARAAFTEPEVLRTNLAALLLRLAADGLGPAEQFPFIDAPDSRALGDGYRLLQELQAFDAERRITPRGRAMARLPLDPRLARALLESARFRAQGELLAIVAGLSVPDARIAPAGQAAHPESTGNAAGPARAGNAAGPAPAVPLEDGKSEFSSLVKIWRGYCKAREGSRRELKRWCQERGLSVLRLSEWEDVYSQVADRAAELGLTPQSRPASYTAVHRALLAGFCTMVGTRGEDGAYLGTRGVRFHIFPGSPLKRRRPRWVMAANIVETSRVFARRVAEIDPLWIEAAAQHLLKREYLEPDWDEAREQVVARERISLLGLVLHANRIVNYGPLAPEEARLIFAREALVYGRLERRPEWLMRNDAAVAAAQRIEERLRTRDLVRPAEYFVAFYDRALPRQVSSSVTLDHFTRHLSHAQWSTLMLTPEDVFARLPEPEQLARFPDRVALAAPGGSPPDGSPRGGTPPEGTPPAGTPPVGTRLDVPVDYRFAPGEEDDGATLNVPLLALPTLTRAAVDAAVPGLAQPCVEALLRSLPKDARRGLIPIAAAAAEFIRFMGAPSTDTARLGEWLHHSRGVPAALIRFDTAAVPAHLIVHLAVTGDPPARGSDVGQLRRSFATAARAELDRRSRIAHPEPWRRFESPTLAEPVALSVDGGGGVVQVHPTLVPGERGVVVRYEWTSDEAAHRFATGVTLLARQVLERQARDLRKRLAADGPLLLAASPYLRGDALVDLVLQLVFRRACFAQGPPERTRAAFDAAVERGREGLHSALDAVVAAARGWFAEARAVRGLLEDARARPHAALAEESRAHLSRLLDARAITQGPSEWNGQLPRFLKAERRRWERLLERGGEAPSIGRELELWNARALNLTRQVDAEDRWLALLDAFRVAVEDYRVSLYAQELRAPGSVSAARLAARAAEIEAWLTR